MTQPSRCLATAFVALLVITIAGAPHVAGAADEPFSEGMVSITFDDGGVTQYELALPILDRYRYKGTYYVITEAIGANEDFMTVAQLRDLVARGHEIGSHTATHPDLPTVNDKRLRTELSASKDWIIQNVGVPDVPSFASPYGGVDGPVLEAIAKFYQSHRSTDEHLNYANGDPYLLGAYGDLVAGDQVARAKSERAWLVVVVHNLSTAPSPGAITVEEFTALIDRVAASGLRVLPVREARALMRAGPPPPALVAVNPKQGPARGGTHVSLTGSGFAPQAVVLFDSTPAVVTGGTATNITADTPAHASGQVDVTVRNPDGRSTTLPRAFRYQR